MNVLNAALPLMAVLIGGAGVAGPSDRRNDFVIARRGQPAEVAVRCAANVGPSGRYAAEELVRYTARMTGVALKTNDVSDVKRTVLLELVPGIRYDGFRLAVSGDTLRVQASLPRGLLYGVYELLETSGGCGWFSSWTENVPSVDVFAVPRGLNRLDEPAFELREPFWKDVNAHSAFGARLRKNSTRYPHLLDDQSPKYGIDEFKPGAGLIGHTFGLLVPPAKYFDEHPEYFSFFNGKRQKERTQLCCTNPDLQKLFVKNFMERVRQDKGDSFFYMVEHDDWNGYCECPNCKALDEREGTHAAGELLLANLCARELRKEFPGRWIKTCGYQWAQTCPKHMRPEPNVYVGLCTIQVDYSAPIAEGENVENRKFVADLEAWGKVMKLVHVTDYSTCFNDYVSPFADLQSIPKNYRYFYENNVRHLFSLSAHCGYHANLCELKAYLQAKLMWNPYADEKAVVRKFCEGYYGQSSAPHVLQYLDDLAAESSKRDHVKEPLVTCTAATTYDTALSPEFHRRGLALWDRALEAARGTTFEYNVRMGWTGALWAVLERQCVQLVADKGGVPPKAVERARLMLESIDIAKRQGRPLVFAEGGYRPRHDFIYTRGRNAWVEAVLKRMVGSEGALGSEVDAASLLTPRAFIGATEVKDAKSDCRTVIRIDSRSGGSWSAVVPTSCIGKTVGKTYRVSVRARVERRPGQPDGFAMSCGIGDRGMRERTWKASEMSGEYRWYDAGTWKVRGDEKRDQAFYLAVAASAPDRVMKPNPVLDAIYVDLISMTPQAEPSAISGLAGQ